MEFAGWLAQLTPADPTPAQRALLESVLTAFLQKSMALDVVTLEHAKAKSQLSDLQRNVGHALANSLTTSRLAASVPTSGPAEKPATLVPPRLSVVRPEGA